MTLDEIIPSYLVGVSKEDIVSNIVDIVVDGKALPKIEVDKWNARLAGKIDECDGGGDAGVAVGGDSGAAPAGEPTGTTNAEVLGNCDHEHDGYLGPGCFHVPCKVKVPLYLTVSAILKTQYLFLDESTKLKYIAKSFPQYTSLLEGSP